MKLGKSPVKVRGLGVNVSVSKMFVKVRADITDIFCCEVNAAFESDQPDNAAYYG